MVATNTPIITHLHAPTHLPIKLTSSNFPIWKKQVESNLIGLDLLGHITGSTTAPTKYSDTARTEINPAYTAWFRQDQIIQSVILGSLSDVLQPVISSVASASDAWTRLSTSCAATSRGRVVSLKAKLAKNPRANRSIDSYMREMRAIADDLALAQSPVSEEDLVVHITQLGDEYNPIVAVLRLRTETISFTYNRCGRGRHNQVKNNGNRSARYCNYCEYPGHDTKFFRKLAKFLKENDVAVLEPRNTARQSPSVHATPTVALPTQSWLMDSGASHHTVNDAMSLHALADYTGPDEIMLGDGSAIGNSSRTGSSRE
ncbi:PREDICTED: uncharacterized protein LOC109180764 [Ipomoea nil]|uniref:uncharacterized protein LOC109180764 n=1 Tax=Ipomoea nil TaxID=35883 RepID=UPI000901D6B9|nr:PREDICTED: uncharacterized protein LOC109180764 [Ipomoea nil]